MKPQSTKNINNKEIQIVAADFNSHETEWGCDENDTNGDRVTSWTISNQMVLVHDAR